MADRPLVVFDFHGVIVDGMAEYWWSAFTAAESLLGEIHGLTRDVVPDAFRQVRPWVHHGWEMVLLAAEMPHLDQKAWLEDYPAEQQCAMLRRGWHGELLQDALDRTRADAVRSDRHAWLDLHRPYPGLVERLNGLASEGADWAVLTTKSEAFTAELLQSMGLNPWHLAGREAGSKPDVLLQLMQNRSLRAFVEDRRATLELVRKTPGLEALPCFLVAWGYLKPSDWSGLPAGIHRLDLDGLSAPLAQWP